MPLYSFTLVVANFDCCVGQFGFGQIFPKIFPSDDDSDEVLLTDLKTAGNVQWGWGDILYDRGVKLLQAIDRHLARNGDPQFLSPISFRSGDDNGIVAMRVNLIFCICV